MEYRSKLRRGGHSGGQLVTASGELASEPAGGFNPGDVIQTGFNLVERYPEKFEEVTGWDDGPKIEPLESLTVAKLQSIAADEQIELDGTERKAEIIEIIRMNREA